MEEPKYSVLFVCVENAGRSQMAEAFAHRYGLKASSAGTVPAPKVNPTVVRAMQEEGIDISRNKPKMLTIEMIEEADLVVTMGCSVEAVCPPGPRKDADETHRSESRRSAGKVGRRSKKDQR